MDIKIENKDIAVDISDNFIEVSGIEQAVQQIKLAIGVKKGSFIYDRSFGSEIHKADFSSDSICKEVESLINESLISLGNVYVTVNSIWENSGNFYADITVNMDYEKKDVEVILNGQL